MREKNLGRSPNESGSKKEHFLWSGHSEHREGALWNLNVMCFLDTCEAHRAVKASLWDPLLSPGMFPIQVLAAGQVTHFQSSAWWFHYPAAYRIVQRSPSHSPVRTRCHLTLLLLWLWPLIIYTLLSNSHVAQHGVRCPFPAPPPNCIINKLMPISTVQCPLIRYYTILYYLK